MASHRLDTAEFDDVLIDIDYPILRLLADERRGTPGYIAQEIGEQQPNVSKRLSELVEEGAVRKVAWGLYEIDDSVILEGQYE